MSSPIQIQINSNKIRVEFSTSMNRDPLWPVPPLARDRISLSGSMRMICPRHLNLLFRIVINRSKRGFTAISWISHLNMALRRHLLLKLFRVWRTVSVMSQASHACVNEEHTTVFYKSLIFMEVGRRVSPKVVEAVEYSLSYIDTVLDIPEVGLHQLGSSYRVN